MTVSPDLREAKIIYQNALAHATQITIHNAKVEGVKVDVDDVIKLARIIAKEVMSLGKDK